MARQISLRKCKTHEGCQLESLNGGPWNHTPQSRTLRTRLASWPAETPRSYEEAVRGIPDSEVMATLDRVQAVSRQATEEARRMVDETADLLVLLEYRTLNQADAHRNLETQLLRNQADTDGAMAHVLAQVDVLRREVAELKRVASEKFVKADSLLERVESRAKELDKLDLRPTVKRLEAELQHEREERIENHRKVMRSFQTIADR